MLVLFIVLLLGTIHLWLIAIVKASQVRMQAISNHWRTVCKQPLSSWQRIYSESIGAQLQNRPTTVISIPYRLHASQFILLPITINYCVALRVTALAWQYNKKAVLGLVVWLTVHCWVLYKWKIKVSTIESNEFKFAINKRSNIDIGSTEPLPGRQNGPWLFLIGLSATSN